MNESDSRLLEEGSGGTQMGTTGTEVASRGRLAKETREGPRHPIACGLWPGLFAFNMKRIGGSKLEEIPMRRLGSEII